MRTKADKARMAAIKESGCVCTLLINRKTVPPDVHHINGVARSYQKTIGLSPWLHRGLRNDGMDTQAMMGVFGPSLAQGRSTFEEYWGSQELLLDIQNLVLDEYERHNWVDYEPPYEVRRKAIHLWTKSRHT